MNSSRYDYDYVYTGGSLKGRRNEVCARVATRGPFGRIWVVRFPDGFECEVNRWTVRNISGIRDRNDQLDSKTM